MWFIGKNNLKREIVADEMIILHVFTPRNTEFANIHVPVSASAHVKIKMYFFIPFNSIHYFFACFLRREWNIVLNIFFEFFF